MARIRTVKPETFKHEELFDLEKKTGLPLRLAWIGIFTICDREGRFHWRPRSIKTDILPYDESINFADILDVLARGGFIVRYEVDGEVFGHIPTWKKHQNIPAKEAKSKIPAPPFTRTALQLQCSSSETNMNSSEKYVVEGEQEGSKEEEQEGKGSKEGSKEGNGKKPEPPGKEPKNPGQTKEVFPVIEQLRGNASLEAVLQSISPGVQKAWVDRYEKKWLKDKLLDAVQHHLAKEKASSTSEIDDWGKRLVKWLRYEKKPSLLNPGANGGPQRTEEEDWEYVFSETVDNAAGGTTP